MRGRLLGLGIATAFGARASCSGLERGVAVLTYDKRGVGRSGGECCPWHDAGYFPLLAEDVLAGVRVLRSRSR